MARQRTAGSTPSWQPAVRPRGTRRPAGHRQWHAPRIRAPRLHAPAISVPQIDARWRRVLAAAIVAGLLAVGGVWLYNSPVLEVHSVKVQGTSALPADYVRAVAALDGESIVRPDFAGARERLLALPLVKEVHISRDFPRGASIKVIERAPWGVWLAGSQPYVIDDEGVVLGLPVPQNVPLIVQTDPPAEPLAAGSRVDFGAVDVAHRLVATAEQTVGHTVTALEFSQANGLTVAFGDLHVLFGDAIDYEYKVAALSGVLDQAAADGRTVSRVDLRFGDRVAVQYGG